MKQRRSAKDVGSLYSCEPVSRSRVYLQCNCGVGEEDCGSCVLVSEKAAAGERGKPIKAKNSAAFVLIVPVLAAVNGCFRLELEHSS